MYTEIINEYYCLMVKKSSQTFMPTNLYTVSTFYGDNPTSNNDFISDVYKNTYITKERKTCSNGVKEFESVW